ncbi:MAG: helix-turn-helix domain-containing protein [Alistipes sp.]|nr:helix-turn-helix domain-containing protein [Alistipes sp.]
MKYCRIDQSGNTELELYCGLSFGEGDTHHLTDSAFVDFCRDLIEGDSLEIFRFYTGTDRSHPDIIAALHPERGVSLYATVERTGPQTLRVGLYRVDESSLMVTRYHYDQGDRLASISITVGGEPFYTYKYHYRNNGTVSHLDYCDGQGNVESRYRFDKKNRGKIHETFRDSGRQTYRSIRTRNRGSESDYRAVSRTTRGHDHYRSVDATVIENRRMVERKHSTVFYPLKENGKPDKGKVASVTDLHMAFEYKDRGDLRRTVDHITGTVTDFRYLYDEYGNSCLTAKSQDQASNLDLTLRSIIYRN